MVEESEHRCEAACGRDCVCWHMYYKMCGEDVVELPDGAVDKDAAVCLKDYKDCLAVLDVIGGLAASGELQYVAGIDELLASVDVYRWRFIMWDALNAKQYTTAKWMFASAARIPVDATDTGVDLMSRMALPTAVIQGAEDIALALIAMAADNLPGESVVVAFKDTAMWSMCDAVTELTASRDNKFGRIIMALDHALASVVGVKLVGIGFDSGLEEMLAAFKELPVVVQDQLKDALMCNYWSSKNDA